VGPDRKAIMTSLFAKRVSIRYVFQARLGTGGITCKGTVPQEAVRPCEQHGLSPGRYLQLRQQVTDVGVDGATADVEPVSNLLVSPSFGYQAEHLCLAPGQAPGWSARGRRNILRCDDLKSQPDQVIQAQPSSGFAELVKFLRAQKHRCLTGNQIALLS
jgi:hypothetical protein